MADSNWLTQFPAMERAELVALRKYLDGTYREFSRTYGDAIETFFDPLLHFLVWFEKLLLLSPWPIVLAMLIGLSFAASRSWKLSLGVLAAFVLIGYFGMWADTMRTLAIITVATLLSIGIGVPIGIAMARSDRVQTIVTPILDIMQTMPAFVYLIPAVMFFSTGQVPSVIATLIFSMPPVVRLTVLGIREVPADRLEAGLSFGCSPSQLLWKVQLPSALPTLMAGVNQTIMLSLSMVVIASMIGGGGLGDVVLRGIQQLNVGLGFEGGLAVVILAVILDRLTQSLATPPVKGLTERWRDWRRLWSD